MKLLHGHIFLVEFNPSSGHEFQKMRPAVIISSDELLQKSNLITCVPFTSNIQNSLGVEDLLVKKTELNRLFCDSVLKTSHISTFDKCRVVKYIGKLEEEVFDSLKKVVVKNFLFKVYSDNVEREIESESKEYFLTYSLLLLFTLIGIGIYTIISRL